MQALFTNDRRIHCLIILASLYLTISFACCTLAFRIVTIDYYSFGASALIYGSIYIIVDAITQLSSTRTCIKLILIFHCCKFIYVYLLYGANFLPAPHSPLTTAYSMVTNPLVALFWGDLFGSVVAGITDILIFASLQKRIKNFFISSFLSTCVVVISHNIPTNYFALRHVFPDKYWQITLINCALAMLAILVTSSVINTLMNKLNFKAQIS